MNSVVVSPISERGRGRGGASGVAAVVTGNEDQRCYSNGYSSSGNSDISATFSSWLCGSLVRSLSHRCSFIFSLPVGLLALLRLELGPGQSPLLQERVEPSVSLLLKVVLEE